MHRVPWYVCIAVLVGISIPAKPGWAQFDSQKVTEDIRIAYERLDFDAASALIEHALANYNQFEPGQLSDIHVVHALLLYSKNEVLAAETQLSQAIQLVPDLVLDPVDTPPALMEIFRSLKALQEVQRNSASDYPEDVRYILLEDLRPGAAVRSMVLPGWGQLYKGEKSRGILLTSAWALAAGGTVVAHINRKQARDHYLASESPEHTADRFPAYSNWHKTRNNLFLAAVGIWVYSYIDAVIKEPKRPENAMQFYAAPGPKSIELGLSIGF